jgi:hypothetical protein
MARIAWQNAEGWRVAAGRGCGVSGLIGYGIPLPGAARNFSYQFHDENKVAKAKQQRPLGQMAYIPRENAALQGLAEMKRDLIRVLGQRRPEHQIGATDQGATIMESRKREALVTYQGEWGGGMGRDGWGVGRSIWRRQRAGANGDTGVGEGGICGAACRSYWPCPCRDEEQFLINGLSGVFWR